MFFTRSLSAFFMFLFALFMSPTRAACQTLAYEVYDLQAWSSDEAAPARIIWGRVRDSKKVAYRLDNSKLAASPGMLVVTSGSATRNIPLTKASGTTGNLAAGNDVFLIYLPLEAALRSGENASVVWNKDGLFTGFEAQTTIVANHAGTTPFVDTSKLPADRDQISANFGLNIFTYWIPMLQYSNMLKHSSGFPADITLAKSGFPQRGPGKDLYQGIAIVQSRIYVAPDAQFFYLFYDAKTDADVGLEGVNIGKYVFAPAEVGTFQSAFGSASPLNGMRYKKYSMSKWTNWLRLYVTGEYTIPPTAAHVVLDYNLERYDRWLLGRSHPNYDKTGVLDRDYLKMVSPLHLYSIRWGQALPMDNSPNYRTAEDVVAKDYQFGAKLYSRSIGLAATASVEACPNNVDPDGLLKIFTPSNQHRACLKFHASEAHGLSDSMNVAINGTNAVINYNDGSDKTAKVDGNTYVIATDSVDPTVFYAPLWVSSTYDHSTQFRGLTRGAGGTVTWKVNCVRQPELIAATQEALGVSHLYVNPHQTVQQSLLEEFYSRLHAAATTDLRVIATGTNEAWNWASAWYSGWFYFNAMATSGRAGGAEWRVSSPAPTRAYGAYADFVNWHRSIVDKAAPGRLDEVRYEGQLFGLDGTVGSAADRAVQMGYRVDTLAGAPYIHYPVPESAATPDTQAFLARIDDSREFVMVLYINSYYLAKQTKTMISNFRNSGKTMMQYFGEKGLGKNGFLPLRSYEAGYELNPGSDNDNAKLISRRQSEGLTDHAEGRSLLTFFTMLHDAGMRGLTYYALDSHNQGNLISNANFTLFDVPRMWPSPGDGSDGLTNNRALYLSEAGNAQPTYTGVVSPKGWAVQTWNAPFGPGLSAPTGLRLVGEPKAP